MSLIRDSLKKVQENSDQQDASSVDSSVEIASQPPQKKKAPTLLFIVVGIAVIALAGFFFFFTSPSEKQKLPSPKIDSPLVAQAPNPTAPPAIQPQPAVPTPGTQPVAGKILSPKVEMKEPVAAAPEIPGKPPVEKEKPGISTSRITPKPMPPVMGTDEKKPARLEDQGLTPKAVDLKRTEKAILRQKISKPTIR